MTESSIFNEMYANIMAEYENNTTAAAQALHALESDIRDYLASQDM